MLVLWMVRPRRQRAPSSPPTERREGMLRVVRTIINALVIVSASLAAAIPAQSQMTAPNPAKVAELKMVLRDLYVNHIFWVRSLVIATRLRQSAAAKVADEEGMENAKEIGQSITPYYGQAASQKFVTLFTGHYVAEKAYMNAAFANNFGGNAAAKKAAENRLMKNAVAQAPAVDNLLNVASAAHDRATKAYSDMMTKVKSMMSLPDMDDKDKSIVATVQQVADTLKIVLDANKATLDALKELRQMQK